MSKPKLTYFNGRGLAEVARLVLAQGGVDFEDVRVEDIKAMKKDDDSVLHFSQVPLYEDKDVRLVQSDAIARYLAAKNGLYGATLAESGLIDVVIDGVGDVRTKYNPVRSAAADKKEELSAEFFNKTLPEWLHHFENWLSRSGDYFVGKRLTLADIYFFHYISTLLNDNAAVVDKFPKVKALIKRVADEPKIAAWIKSRPVTPF